MQANAMRSAASTTQSCRPSYNRASTVPCSSTRVARHVAKAQRPSEGAGRSGAGSYPGEDAPGTGQRNFPAAWQDTEAERHNNSEGFEMRSASEVVNMFDAFLGSGAPTEEAVSGAANPQGGVQEEVEDRVYADGPSTGNRRRPEAMIDRDVRDKDRTAERFELRSAQEVASRFESLPGAATEVSSDK